MPGLPGTSGFPTTRGKRRYENGGFSSDKTNADEKNAEGKRDARG